MNDEVAWLSIYQSFYRILSTGIISPWTHETSSHDSRLKNLVLFMLPKIVANECFLFVFFESLLTVLIFRRTVNEKRKPATFYNPMEIVFLVNYSKNIVSSNCENMEISPNPLSMNPPWFRANQSIAFSFMTSVIYI